MLQDKITILLIASLVGSFIYRLMEFLDGEHGFKIIPYKLAERIKWHMAKYIF